MRASDTAQRRSRVRPPLRARRLSQEIVLAAITVLGLFGAKWLGRSCSV